MSDSYKTSNLFVRINLCNFEQNFSTEKVMIKKYLILFILFTFPSYLFSQYTPEIDSLIDVTAKMSTDTNKAKNLNTICWKLKTKDFDVAVEYGLNAIKISQELNFKSEEALANKNLGGVYYLRSNYTISYDYYTNSLELFKEIGDSINTAKVIRNIGSIFVFFWCCCLHRLQHSQLYIFPASYYQSG